jgi:hypothetical protein
MKKGAKFIQDLSKLLKGWEFNFVDALGHSGGLVTDWKINIFSLTNYWGFDLGLGVSHHSPKLGKEINYLNIYKPYMNHLEYWDHLFSRTWLRKGQVILGSDLNFTLGGSKFWGPMTQVDSCRSFFLSRENYQHLRENLGGNKKISPKFYRGGYALLIYWNILCMVVDE